MWNHTPDSLTGLPYFLSGECFTLKSGYGESGVNLFLTTAYINLSVPVPALAKKANAYLYHFGGVGAFNFFPSESPLSKKVLIRPARSLSIHESLTKSKPNERRKCFISSGQRKQFLSL